MSFGWNYIISAEVVSLLILSVLNKNVHWYKGDELLLSGLLEQVQGHSSMSQGASGLQLHLAENFLQQIIGKMGQFPQFKEV